MTNRRASATAAGPATPPAAPAQRTPRSGRSHQIAPESAQKRKAIAIERVNPPRGGSIPGNEPDGEHEVQIRWRNVMRLVLLIVMIIALVRWWPQVRSALTDLGTLEFSSGWSSERGDLVTLMILMIAGLGLVRLLRNWDRR